MWEFGAVTHHPTAWMLLPLALWLALVAGGPLCGPWWTRHGGKLALLFTAASTGWYCWRDPAAASVAIPHAARDYFSFIVLLGSLYVAAGGVFVHMTGCGGPGRNVLFLAAGGLLANLVGTTGACLLLIRPWLKMQGVRAGPRHVAFFIFIVGNIGGGLTPLGDPPLLLGYIKGVPFWWVAQNCFLPWLTAMFLLLFAWYLIDRRDPAPWPDSAPGGIQIEGGGNAIFLAIIAGAALLPERMFLRETVMLASAAGSWLATDQTIRRKNEFDFGPIIELAAVFLAIFGTMTPALAWLQNRVSASGGIAVSPARVFWSAGVVSAFLDNAPVYWGFAASWLAGGGVGRSFLAAAPGSSASLAALSVATVFFGGMTYVGNGPNLMVKAMAERHGVKAPGFAGYIFKWSVPILLPLLLVIGMIFFND